MIKVNYIKCSDLIDLFCLLSLSASPIHWNTCTNNYNIWENVVQYQDFTAPLHPIFDNKTLLLASLFLCTVSFNKNEFAR